MMGRVDFSGRALVPVLIRPTAGAPGHDVEAWIDTGFTGDLVLPQQQIEHLSLPQSGTVQAVLADGSQVVLSTYSCVIDWFGTERHLEVVANDGQFPLLGVGLLLGLDLQISYRSRVVTIQ